MKRNKMYQKISYIFLVLFCIVIFMAGQTYASNLKLVSEFESGKLYKSGKINVLTLRGNFREMGRQYGKLLKNDLNEFYNSAIKECFIKKQKVPYDIMLKIGRGVFEFYPKRFKEIIYGMSETSGLNVEELLILNAVEFYTSISGVNMGCSGIAVWNGYTQGKPLIFGRDYEYFKYYKEFSKFLTVVVFNPNDGSNPTASIGLAGQIYVVNGINKEGLFLELNNAMPSVGPLFYPNRIHMIVMLFTYLFNSSTMEQLDAAFNTGRACFPYIINAADKNEAFSYEWAPFDIKRRSSNDTGLLVSTTHFVDPSWGLPEPPDGSFLTQTRYKNLLSLAKKYKGGFNVEKMMLVLDTPVHEGGPTLTGKSITQFATIYQIIAVPEKLKLWIKAPDYQDWTEVDLNRLFK